MAIHRTGSSGINITARSEKRKPVYRDLPRTDRTPD
jgi:hypothetical protein